MQLLVLIGQPLADSIKAKPLLKNLTRPTGLLVDLGDTLLQATNFELLAGIRKMFSMTHQAETLQMDMMRKEGDVLGKACEEIRSLASYEVNFEAFHRNLFDRFGITSDYSWQELDLEFLKESHKFTLEDGLIESLEEIKSLGIKMAIVSNSFHCGASLEWLTRSAGIDKYFSFLISTADYGFRKPHPQIFETAIARIGMPREKLWFIGDKPEFDIKGAKGVGMTAVWYNGDNEPPCEPEPDLTVKSWAELVEILKLTTN